MSGVEYSFPANIRRFPTPPERLQLFTRDPVYPSFIVRGLDVGSCRLVFGCKKGKSSDSVRSVTLLRLFLVSV